MLLKCLTGVMEVGRGVISQDGDVHPPASHVPRCLVMTSQRAKLNYLPETWQIKHKNMSLASSLWNLSHDYTGFISMYKTSGWKILKLKKQVWVSAYWRDPPIQQQATASPPWPSPPSCLLIPSLHSAWAASMPLAGTDSRAVVFNLSYIWKFILILGSAKPQVNVSASPKLGEGRQVKSCDCYMQPRLTAAAPEGQSHSNLVPVWGRKPVLLQWLRR